MLIFSTRLEQQIFENKTTVCKENRINKKFKKKEVAQY